MKKVTVEYGLILQYFEIIHLTYVVDIFNYLNLQLYGQAMLGSYCACVKDYLLAPSS